MAPAGGGDRTGAGATLELDRLRNTLTANGHRAGARSESLYTPTVIDPCHTRVTRTP